MTATNPTRTATRSNNPPVRQTTNETCPATYTQGVRRWEAEQAFEAGVQWFLAVSRAA